MLCLLFSGFIAGTADAQKGKSNFVIEGTISNMPIMPEKVYLTCDTAHKAMDSAFVKAGKYTFRGSIEEPVMVTIEKYDYDAEGRRVRTTTTYGQVVFFLDKGTVKVSSAGTISNAVITGSQADVDYHLANHRMDLWGDSVRKIYKMAQETKNAMLLNSFFTPENLHKVDLFMREDYPAFIRTHPASGVNLHLLRTLITLEPKAGGMEAYDSLFRLLPATTRSGTRGRNIETMLDNYLKTAIGHKAADFTQPDAAGHEVSLSSFKGKYVLLNFWASWDANATETLPLLAKANSNYAGKGLVVLGVSLDTDKNSWQQAIQAKNISGTEQLSDLKGKNNPVAQLYGVTSLPGMLLIDPNGTIIATRLDQFSLNKTLTSIFE